MALGCQVESIVGVCVTAEHGECHHDHPHVAHSDCHIGFSPVVLDERTLGLVFLSFVNVVPYSVHAATSELQNCRIVDRRAAAFFSPLSCV